MRWSLPLAAGAGLAALAAIEPIKRQLSSWGIPFWSALAAGLALPLAAWGAWELARRSAEKRQRRALDAFAEREIEASRRRLAEERWRALEKRSRPKRGYVRTLKRQEAVEA